MNDTAKPPVAAPKAGHWYTSDGEPMHWINKKSGQGTRPTTIADARLLGLKPSVTKVIDDVLAKPALTRWITHQAVMAVSTAPDRPGESLDDKINRVLYVERQQDEEAAQARDRGTAIHDALEKIARFEPYDPAIDPWVKPAWAKVKSEFPGEIVATEHILIGKGYGGRTDLIVRALAVDWVIDFKTCKTLPTKGAWNEHKLQLGAYGRAWEEMHPERLVGVANVYICTGDPAVLVWKTNSWELAAQTFDHLLSIWAWLNSYDPR